MWKEILKIDMEEARRLGDKYAPEDMEEARIEEIRANFTKVKPTILKILEGYTLPDLEGMDSRSLRSILVSLMRGLPNAPRLYGSHSLKARKQNKEMIEDYLDDLELEYLRR